ncbi:MAG: type II toxin-antitoxin system VapC family toxin [Parvularculaceae bacterium]|nr:type II toxin-antitoxin system VapC family toxin [Parvularculaceae bacterium]
MLADVNVLVSAFRPDTERHVACREWLVRAIEDDAPFALSPQILSSVLRILTYRKVFKPPSPLMDALAFADNLLGQPHARIVTPGDQHWLIFRELCIAADARDNLIPAAWFAALAIEHGCEFVTLDRDYARFPRLRWLTPDSA